MENQAGFIFGKLIPIYDHLAGTNPKTGEYQPELATSWSVASDGRTWNFKLRQNVPFYRDGKATDTTMTADDVVHSWKVNSGEASTKTISVRAEFGGRVDATIHNDYDVSVRLAQISLDLTYLVSDSRDIAIYSKDHWDALGEDGYAADPIGNGPWTFVDLVFNGHALLKRVENHYRKTPDFPEVQFIFVAEAATRMAALLAKEVHMTSVPRSLHGQVRSAGMVVWKSTLPGAYLIVRVPYYKPDNYVNPATGEPFPGMVTGPTEGYNPDSPLRDPRVREALNLAIDRNQISTTFYNGDLFPSHGLFPPWERYFKDEWLPYPGPDGKTGREGGWPYPYDPAKARQLLADAGYPDGFETTLLVTAGADINLEAPDVGLALRDYWNAIGVRAKVEVGDNPIVQGHIRNRDLADTMFMVSPATNPISIDLSFYWYESGRGWLDYDEVSNFKKAYDATTDAATREKMVQEFGDWWVSNRVDIPIGWVFGYAVANPSVVNEYMVNHLNIGITRYQEYTKAVFR
jgi:peptide/nickel transport system substrate-binding protein